MRRQFAHWLPRRLASGVARRIKFASGEQTAGFERLRSGRSARGGPRRSATRGPAARTSTRGEPRDTLWDQREQLDAPHDSTHFERVDFHATEFISVVPALLHYARLKLSRHHRVVQKRGNHRREVGGESSNTRFVEYSRDSQTPAFIAIAASVRASQRQRVNIASQALRVEISFPRRPFVTRRLVETVRKVVRLVGCGVGVRD